MLEISCHGSNVYNVFAMPAYVFAMCVFAFAKCIYVYAVCVHVFALHVHVFAYYINKSYNNKTYHTSINLAIYANETAIDKVSIT